MRDQTGIANSMCSSCYSSSAPPLAQTKFFICLSLHAAVHSSPLSIQDLSDRRQIVLHQQYLELESQSSC